jgi:transcriptional regulator with XRE-family HTH domain
VSQRPSEGIGQRIAEYRRLAGLSARDLAEAAGMGLTRGVVANIESGRKSDISVDQLIAIAFVLGIPPVALALPLSTPFHKVRLADSMVKSSNVPTWVAVKMFVGEPLDAELGYEENRTGASSTGFGRWHNAESYVDTSAALDFLRGLPDALPEHIEQREKALVETEHRLKQLLVDLSPDPGGDDG